MTWIKHHRASEICASQAEVYLREGRREEARKQYALAAAAEEKALAALDLAKTRTYGITAVSAASLHFKARQTKEAERVALRSMRFDRLPAFAQHQLRHLLQVVWAEETRQNTDLRFAPGQVLVSVNGGQVVTGGAPLAPVLGKVKTVESVLHRTVEFLSGTHHRKRGPPSKRIQEEYRAWLFQAPPASFQFAVAIQESGTGELLGPPKGEVVADFFLDVLRLSCEGTGEDFAKAIPDPDYRETFLKLIRNLTPTGKVFDNLVIRSADDTRAVSLNPETRQSLGKRIRKLHETSQPSSRPAVYDGVLRAVHLDRDWLEVAVQSRNIRVDGVGEQVDDVVGPLVNKQVHVHVVTNGDKHNFVDIEPDE